MKKLAVGGYRPQPCRPHRGGAPAPRQTQTVLRTVSARARPPKESKGSKRQSLNVTAFCAPPPTPPTPAVQVPASVAPAHGRSHLRCAQPRQRRLCPAWVKRGADIGAEAVPEKSTRSRTGPVVSGNHVRERTHLRQIAVCSEQRKVLADRGQPPVGAACKDQVLGPGLLIRPVFDGIDAPVLQPDQAGAGGLHRAVAQADQRGLRRAPPTSPSRPRPPKFSKSSCVFLDWVEVP